jgi:ABC-type anion transport system duplicated permease subunit
MDSTTTPRNWKHIGAAAVLGTVIGAAAVWHLKPPQIETREVEVVKTEVKIQEVVKWRDRVRTRVETRPDGTRIETKETDKLVETRDAVTQKEEESRSREEVRPAQSSYLVGVQQTLPLDFTFSRGPAPTIYFGARIGTLPLFITVGHNLEWKFAPIAGVQFEF